jgi:glutathione S-transferase
MKLIVSPTSPYSRKTRIVARECGMEVEEVMLIPWDSPEQLLARNPLSKVPVLERDDSSMLYDSYVICEYLDYVAGGTLVPRDGEERWQVLRWHALAQGMVDACVARFLEARRPQQSRSDDWIQRQEAAINRSLKVAEREVRASAGLVGEAFSLADIALGVALGYIDFRYRNGWRDDHPQLAQWVEPVFNRPSFQATAPPVQ